MQLLAVYIEKNFKNNKAAYARHMKVSSQQITRWINELYSPRRCIPKFAIASNAIYSSQKSSLHHENSTKHEHRKHLTLDIEQF